MTADVVVEGVWKSFGDRTVLADVSLAAAEHEVVCLIGASGSGKSTLLRCVNLLEPVDDGRILLGGEDITEPGLDQDAVRRRLGMVFQSYNLFPHLSVVANVTLAPRKVLGRPHGEVEADAGYEGDPHEHEHAEFLYVLSGRVRTQGREMQAGDAYVAAAGSTHSDFATPDGATYLSIFRL